MFELSNQEASIIIQLLKKLNYSLEDASIVQAIIKKLSTPIVAPKKTTDG